MSLWIQFIAVKEDDKEKELGDRWRSNHKSYTPANPDDEEYEVSIDLDKLPEGTKRLIVRFTP